MPQLTFLPQPSTLRCAFQWRLVPATQDPTSFYGNQPLQPLDKAGLVYRLPDSAEDQQAAARAGGRRDAVQGAARGGGQLPTALPQSAGLRAKAPLGGGGYGMPRR